MSAALIIIAIAGSYEGGVCIHHIQFQNLEIAEEAKKKIDELKSPHVRTVCVKTDNLS